MCVLPVSPPHRHAPFPPPQAYHCAVQRFPGESLSHVADPSVPFCDGCPPNTTVGYDHCKQHPEIVELGPLLDYARAQSGVTIDPLSHLTQRRVFLYVFEQPLSRSLCGRMKGDVALLGPAALDLRSERERERRLGPLLFAALQRRFDGALVGWGAGTGVWRTTRTTRAP